MRQRHTPEQIIAKLREADVLIAQGKPVDRAAEQIGATVPTYYRWLKTPPRPCNGPTFT